MINSNPHIAIQSCGTYQAESVHKAIAEALDSLGGLDQFIQRGDRVLIKPNLLFGRPPEQAVTTHPVVIEAICRMALDCGAKVLLGDSPPLSSAARTTKRCGIADVVNQLGVEIVEFKHPTHDGWNDQIYTTGIATPPLSSVLQEVDLVINVPKLKAHEQLLITCAVKNLFGCVVGRTKAYWHFKKRKSVESFAAMLLAIYEKISPGLTIVDAITGMEGMGPGNGSPKQVGLIIAGENAVTVDAVITEILGINSLDHFVVRMAENLGFPGSNIDQIKISGLPVKEARLDSFELPELTPIGFSIPHLIKGIFKYIREKTIQR